jgi:hypothetical protein
MRLPALLAVVMLAPSIAASQDLTGTWSGALDVQGTRLRLVVHIAKTDSGYRTTLDSPDQGATGIPVAVTTFNPPDVTLGLPNLGARFQGVLAGDSIAGTWSQGMATLPLVLRKENGAPPEVRQPPEPDRPYPNRHQSVRFESDVDRLTLTSTSR